MGLVRMGPPEELVLFLRGKYQLSHFIETGTYGGDTAAWAASLFARVTTIEASEPMYRNAVAKHGTVHNIDFLHDDSVSALGTIVPDLEEPVLVWLDAHWCGDKTYGEDHECALLEKLGTLKLSKREHFVLIDDARLFLSPPPRPHRRDHWPRIDEVVEGLKAGREAPYIAIAEDVIIAVPRSAGEEVAKWCQDVNTGAWSEQGRHHNDAMIAQGRNLIVHGLRLIGIGLCLRLKQVGLRLLRGVLPR
ncbi:MAG: hypothetical protein COS85_21125 [Armatimonadetes bacterium CG07_land_8_20_14_0_80_59_28]|nr:MAG: hypothetical protein COS85_21125 [Armatimonadetes bacterium CG07_land_8_20_14_0_80_59_28]PIX45055.1 MAG: hypothetical protein COZ56_02860 [Armatimonadetes bacterium CG_4_8_14_3_um_filter_58_9]PJB75803.1 MAG: hypothetical protein CO095_03380 [Armatimonadetes bacterium CG_4_9_14_3_um_filter_58_7]